MEEPMKGATEEPVKGTEEREEEEMEEEEEVEDDPLEDYKAWAEEVSFVMYGFVNSSKVSDTLADVVWLPNGGVEEREYHMGCRGKVHKLVAGSAGEGPNYIMLIDTVVPNEFVPGLRGDPRADPSYTSAVTTVTERMLHPTPCYRMACIPQRPHILAANTTHGDIILYDLLKKEPVSTKRGHTKEGFGLEWCPLRDGLLASGSYDTTVKIWDAEAELPVRSIRAHEKEVGGLGWSGHSPCVLASGGDDGMLCLWDTRAEAAAAKVMVEGEEGAERELGINNVCYNKGAEEVHTHLLITGDTQGRVIVRDDRKLGIPLTTLPVDGEVTTLRWLTGGCPQEDSSRFIAGYEDGRTEIYDLTQTTLPYHTGAGQGDSCLVATHYGHKSQCEAVASAPLQSMNADGCIASVEADGYLQVWRFNEMTLDMKHGMYDTPGLVRLPGP